MITDYDDNKTTLESIEEQYTELCDKDIGSIDYSKDRVQTTPTNDSAASAMVRKEDLEKRIREYSLFFKVYDPAWLRLTEKEKFILMSFVSYRKKQDAIDRICDQYGIEVSQAYRLKNEAASRFRRLMFG
jgi:hypothetical protein